MLKDVCIFAHYDQHDMVDDYVVWYLRALAEAGFSIVMVSTSNLRPDAIAKVRTLCIDVIVRENIGHDFGSWSVGLARYLNMFSGDLLLANDSVYGPVGHLGSALNRLRSSHADFCGMVESREHVPHIQSWFMLFRPIVWRHPSFASVFCRTPEALLKQKIIEQGELFATEHLRSAGFQWTCLHTALNRRIATNPTHFLWRELIEKDGIPFVKVELLKRNPANVYNVEAWRDVVGQRCEGLVPLIENHLGRVLERRKAPKHAVFVGRIFGWFARNDDGWARSGRPFLSELNVRTLCFVVRLYGLARMTPRRKYVLFMLLARRVMRSSPFLEMKNRVRRQGL